MLKLKVGLVLLAALALSLPAGAAGISGKVVDASGKPMEGVTVSAFDPEREMSVSVFSQADGSFAIDGLRDATFNVRGRLIGDVDTWQENVKAGAKGLKIAMKPAQGEALDQQRTGDNLFGLMKWEDEKDKANFKMSCGYCHQIGTVGFRSPEEPVDWETMITRMDGFGGLYKHSQDTIVQRLINTYTDEAMQEWPEFVPPPAPEGAETKAKITEWDVGRQDACMIHDLELGSDGKVYAVDMTNDAIYSLDPETGAREVISFPGGKDPNEDTNPRLGPHSIERDQDGNMWVTLALSGQMGKYDVKTGEFTIVSSAPAPRPRGAYPHTLRVETDLAKDPKGRVWYTDAGSDVFSLDPTTHEVVQYKLPTADQAVGGGRGESRGRTPYGLSISPTDGIVWYTKLNGNRVGRIDPNLAPDEAVTEWEPPFRGPRRLEVGPDGMVWVPGFADGVLGKFDPKTQEWEVIDLPDAMNQIPYALSVNQQNGDVWICGTMNDTMLRYETETKKLTEYRMPSRVTYTREVEFGDDGSVWVCNSNYPVRHTERGKGSIIKIELTD
jgi:streptogramin lyase